MHFDRVFFRYFIPSLFGAEKFTGGTPHPLLRITPLCLAIKVGVYGIADGIYVVTRISI